MLFEYNSRFLKIWGLLPERESPEGTDFKEGQPLHEGMEEPHVFLHGGHRLFGVWHHADPPDAPIVIFHHGFTATKSEHHRIFVKQARRLAGEGFDSFRFDFYGSS